MIPVAELRAWVGAADTPENNALLVQLEARAVADVELTTGAYLGASDSVVDRIIGDGSTVLRLPKAPVTAVASVAEAWTTDPDLDSVTITEFALRSPLLYRSGGAVWIAGAEYEVSYTAGYAADAFPPLYRQAVLDIVKATYDAQTSSQSTEEQFKKETFGDYSYERFSGPATSNDAASSVKTILAQLPKRVRV